MRGTLGASWVPLKANSCLPPQRLSLWLPRPAIQTPPPLPCGTFHASIRGHRKRCLIEHNPVHRPHSRLRGRVVAPHACLARSNALVLRLRLSGLGLRHKVTFDSASGVADDDADDPLNTSPVLSIASITRHNQCPNATTASFRRPLSPRNSRS